MNGLIAMVAENVFGHWVTTTVGGTLIWTNVSRVAAEFAAGKSILEVAMSPEFQAMMAGLAGLFVRDPHKA